MNELSSSGFSLPPASIDPISLEILWQRLISIMDEVDQIIVRTTFSTILRESRDFACILTDTNGSSLYQSVHGRSYSAAATHNVDTSSWTCCRMAGAAHSPAWTGCCLFPTRTTARLRPVK